MSSCYIHGWSSTQADCPQCPKKVPESGCMGCGIIKAELERVTAERDELKELFLAEHQAAVDMFGKYDAARDEADRLREALGAAKEGLLCISALLSLEGAPAKGEKYAQSRSTEALTEIARIESGKE